MSGRMLQGLSAAGGVAVARALVLREPEPVAAGPGGADEQERAAAALDHVAGELRRLAEAARRAGREADAEILEANLLMVDDPVLRDEVAGLAASTPAEQAIRAATERHAALLASIDDPLLAARAADVRQAGVRAVRHLAGAPALVLPATPVIVLARDLGPADVAELQSAGDRIRGIALAEGAATSHAAIMARALGLPMAVGLGEELLAAADGEEVVLDGENGVVVIAPGAGVRARALAAVERRARDRAALAASRGLPARTRDGRTLRLLCNASTEAEVAAGLDQGAEGVGLVRTELAFLDAPGWPGEEAHAAALAPVLGPLAGRTATVRTLDFGLDKCPPFLAGTPERGVALALANPAALVAQLRAILRAGAGTDLRIMLPLVEDVAQLAAARRLLLESLDAVGWHGPPPQLGAMIETPTAAAKADSIAAEADFLSIGTNDLVQYTLGLDRTLPLASAQAAADPRVLRLVGAVVETAHARRIGVEICGEAAGELPLVRLFVGLGVDELSVAPARLDEARAGIRALSAAEAAATAAVALTAPSAARALALANELRSGQAVDEVGEARNRGRGVLA